MRLVMRKDLLLLHFINLVIVKAKTKHVYNLSLRMLHRWTKKSARLSVYFAAWPSKALVDFNYMGAASDLKS